MAHGAVARPAALLGALAVYLALGAVSAIRAAGKVGKVQVVGYDNIDAIKPMLKDGRVLATADQAAAKQAVCISRVMRNSQSCSTWRGSPRTVMSMIPVAVGGEVRVT